MLTPLRGQLTPLAAGRLRPAAAAFSPASLPGLRQWIESDYGIAVPSGSGIPTWSDRSGHGADMTQATAGSRLIYQSAGGPNGKPRAVASGSQFMDFDLGNPDSGGMSLFVVVKPSGTAALLWGPSGRLLALSGSSITLDTGGGHASGAYTDNSWIIAEGHANGSTAFAAVNGIEASPASDATYWFPSQVAIQQSLYAGLYGSIAAQLIFSPMLSPANRLALRNYLNANYLIY